MNKPDLSLESSIVVHLLYMECVVVLSSSRMSVWFSAGRHTARVGVAEPIKAVVVNTLGLITQGRDCMWL